VVRFRNDSRVERVIICSPDKDLAQLVSGERVVCWDRRRDIVYDEPAVIKKYGVPPKSIPDWLALVGDKADGIPGIPAWGAKSAAQVLSCFEHIEDIPDDTSEWDISTGRSRRLAENLAAQWDDALLFRHLATLRTDVPIVETVDDLEWCGPQPEFEALCKELGVDGLLDQVK
jgi:5'-3' exonuclease